MFECTDFLNLETIHRQKTATGLLWHSYSCTSFWDLSKTCRQTHWDLEGIPVQILAFTCLYSHSWDKCTESHNRPEDYQIMKLLTVEIRIEEETVGEWILYSCTTLKTVEKKKFNVVFLFTIFLTSRIWTKTSPKKENEQILLHRLFVSLIWFVKERCSESGNTVHQS